LICKNGLTNYGIEIPSLFRIEGNLDFGEEILAFFDSWVDVSNFVDQEFSFGCSAGKCDYFHID
jgi:hypothetical protein